MYTSEINKNFFFYYLSLEFSLSVLYFSGFTIRYQHERSSSVTNLHLHQLKKKNLLQASTSISSR